MADLSTTAITVTVTAYAASPDVTFGFESDSVTVLNRSTVITDIIYVSFDGETDAGITIPGIAQAINWTAKRQKVWLRRSAAGSSTVNVMANTVR